VVLDAWATRIRPRDAVGWVAQLERLDAGDAVVFLDRAGAAGLDAAVWAERGHQVGVKLGDRVVAPAVAEAALAALRASLAAFHKANPLARGASRAAARVGVLRALTDRAWDGLLGRLSSEGEIAEEGPLVRLASHSVELTPKLRGLMDRVTATLAARGLVGVDWAELKAAHREPELEPVVALLAADQVVVHVGGVGLVEAAALARLRAWLRERFSAGGGLAPSDLKDAWELTRKTSVPLLEWTDKAGWTRRLGEGRVAGPALEAA
jgi:selenocysteine-specific elongation factor